jgi:hypothetical protein
LLWCFTAWPWVNGCFLLAWSLLWGSLSPTRSHWGRTALRTAFHPTLPFCRRTQIVGSVAIDLENICPVPGHERKSTGGSLPSGFQGWNFCSRAISRSAKNLAIRASLAQIESGTNPLSAPSVGVTEAEHSCHPGNRRAGKCAAVKCHQAKGE